MSFHVAQEEHMHTYEQVEQYVVDAIRLAVEQRLSANDRAALLPTIVTLLSQKQIWYEQMAGLGAMAIPRNRRG